MAKSRAVINPNLGLYLDRSIMDVPKGGLQDGYNFRIAQGKLTNTNLGWTAFASFTLNGTVTLIATLHLRSNLDVLIFGTPTDLYKYSTSGGGSVTYISPIYATGTAAASGTAVTGTGTLWNTGTPKNVKAGDEISFGSATQNLPSAIWYTVASVTNDTALVLTTSAGTIAGGVYTVRKKFSGTAATPWISDAFVNAQPSSEDRIYLTNGADAPVRWNGTDAQVTVLNSLGFTCSSLVVYKNMLLFGNLVQSGTSKPTDFINSDVASPEVINSGLASQFKVAGTTDRIVMMKKMGDYLVIYLTKMIIITNFVGSPLVFVFRVAVEGKGILSPRAIAMYPSYHEFLAADTLYAFDGSTAKQISNHVWREIIRISDPSRLANVYTFLDETRGDYGWSVPLTSDAGAGTLTSPNVSAFVEHYLEEVPQGLQRPYSKRAFPFTAVGYYARQAGLTWDQLTSAWSTYNFRWNDQFFAASFPQVIAGDSSGHIWIVNGAQDANSAALPSFVKFGRGAVSDGRNRGLVTRVFPFVTQFTNAINVTINLADFPHGPATIRNTVSFAQALTEGLFFAPMYRVGRFVDVEFGTDGPSQPYEINGYDIAMSKGGDR